jgi:hypothetical protein
MAAAFGTVPKLSSRQPSTHSGGEPAEDVADCAARLSIHDDDELETVREFGHCGKQDTTIEHEFANQDTAFARRDAVRRHSPTCRDDAADSQSLRGVLRSALHA